MKLYILRAKGPVGYDNYEGFVVRANSSREARRLASAMCGPYSNGPVWLDKKKSSCRPLAAEGKAGVVLDSFRAG